MQDSELQQSLEILVTSEQGDKLASKPNVVFERGCAEGDVITVQPDLLNQQVLGIGSSITESSAFVLAHLDPEKRAEVMKQIFSEDGANFPLVRTPIGSCDFCVEGKYSYDDVKDDRELTHFSIAVDKDGFSRKRYSGIRDESFDLLPMIQQAKRIKDAQDDKTFRVLASPWTAPVWMKDIETWYQPGTPENNYQGTGGQLKPEYASVFADYLIKYLNAYRDQGVSVWGITPVNEPLGNSGQWESMHFTPESQAEFIKKYLGDKLHQSECSDTKLLMFDHARDKLEEWADVIYRDDRASKYVYGAAVHWYESTFKVYEEIFDRVHAKYPDFAILHSEGCIDNLGNEAPGGVLDPEGYKESGWFDNDAFWWNANATDWAYTATWQGVHAEDHPKYAPVHRYARNIIVSLNHWLTAWIDWNIVLDKRGGPNHVGNYCGAPIMIDTDSGYVYYTPVFYVLSQLSRTIRPGDRMADTKVSDSLAGQGVYACASLNDDNVLSVQVLNTEKMPGKYALQIGEQFASVAIDANALQTVRVQL